MAHPIAVRLHTGGRHARHGRRRGVLAPQSLWTFVRTSSVRTLLTVPMIYSMGIPLLLLDVWVTAYQRICFPIYRIAPVRRRAHFAVDRHRLPYLNAIEKVHCFYCSYATGLLTYVSEITARTEQYWCPIKHAGRIRAPHRRYRQFVDYDNAGGYRRRLPGLRRSLGRGHRP